MSDEVIEPKNDFNPNQVLMSERERIKSIMNLCKLAKNEECIEKFIESGATVDAERSFLFDQMVANTAEPTVNAISQQSSQHVMLNYMVQGLKGA